MISYLFVILSAFTLCSVALSATLYCNNPLDKPLTGIVNSDVIVDGENCTMVGATINGDVTVINHGFLRTYGNTVLQKKLTGRSGAKVEVYESIVNDRIRVDNSERLDLTDSTINGRVSADNVASVDFVISTFDKDVRLSNIADCEILGSQTFRGSLTSTLNSGSKQPHASLRIIGEAIISGKLTISGILTKRFSSVNIEDATMENEVSLTDVGVMQIQGRSQLKKGLSTKRLGNVFIQGSSSKVVVDGPIEDVDGTDAFIANGVKFTSSLTITNRNGNSYVENLGNRPVEINGEIVVEGGTGYFFLRYVSSFVQKFTCRNHGGKVTVAGIGQSNSMSFDSCEKVAIEDTTVNDRLSIENSDSVVIHGSTCRNVIEIKNTASELSLTDNLSNNFVDLENNLEKVSLKDNVFNRIKCTDNANINASNNRANQVIGNCGFK